jgi:hypothetical protein
VCPDQALDSVKFIKSAACPIAGVPGHVSFASTSAFVQVARLAVVRNRSAADLGGEEARPLETFRDQAAFSTSLLLVRKRPLEV